MSKASHSVVTQLQLQGYLWLVSLYSRRLESSPPNKCLRVSERKIVVWTVVRRWLWKDFSLLMQWKKIATSFGNTIDKNVFRLESLTYSLLLDKAWMDQKSLVLNSCLTMLQNTLSRLCIFFLLIHYDSCAQLFILIKRSWITEFVNPSLSLSCRPSWGCGMMGQCVQAQCSLHGVNLRKGGMVNKRRYTEEPGEEGGRQRPKSNLVSCIQMRGDRWCGMGLEVIWKCKSTGTICVFVRPTRRLTCFSGTVLDISCLRNVPFKRDFGFWKYINIFRNGKGSRLLMNINS